MKVALAGVSHWHAAMHLDAVLHAGAEPVAAWDADGRVDLAIEARVPICDSLEVLLQRRPDLIVVMGHPAEVPATARAALAAGIPMILEKPAAATTAALALLAEQAARTGHFVAVPFANRASPIWDEMARLRAVNRLGAISHAQFRIINGPPSRYRDDGVAWLLDPTLAGGGAMRNLGLHGIDAALVLCGDVTPECASAQLRASLFGERVEEYAIATLAVPGGPVVTVEAGYTYASIAPGGDFAWRVSTANAYLQDRGDTCWVATRDDGQKRALAPIPPGLRYRWFMTDTLDRLARGAPPATGLSDYLCAMHVVDHIYRIAGR